MVGTLLLLWLGGILGYGSVLVANADAARGVKYAFASALKRNPQARASVVVVSTIGMAIQFAGWPLMLVLAPIVHARLRKMIKSKRGVTIEEISCSVCERKSDAVVLGDHAWVSFSPDWYINVEHEVVCSSVCAAQKDRGVWLTEQKGNIH